MQLGSNPPRSPKHVKSSEKEGRKQGLILGSAFIFEGLKINQRAKLRHKTPNARKDIIPKFYIRGMKI